MNIEQGAATTQAMDAAPAAEAALDAVTQRFVDTLERLAGFADTSAEHADGYLSAIACCPKPPAFDAWIEPLAEDAFARCFGDPQDAAAAREALEAHLARIGEALAPAALAQDPDRLMLQPYMLEWTAEQRAAALADEGAAASEARAEGQAQGLDPSLALHTGAEWALGFLQGLQAWIPQQLPALPRQLQEEEEGALQQIEGLLLGAAGEAFQAHCKRHWAQRSPSRDELIDAALLAVQDLRLLWFEASLTPEPLRRETKVGRNDPCPCGSGRKFKKCHGSGADPGDAPATKPAALGTGEAAST